MADTHKWYLGGPEAALASFESGTVKVAAVGPGYTFNQDTHDFFNDISDEIVDAGYTAGGITLTGKTLTVDAATNKIKLDADNVDWDLTGPEVVHGFVTYISTGVASTSALLSFLDLDPNRTVENGNIEIQWHADGLLRGTVAA
jgi:hypothetical protein